MRYRLMATYRGVPYEAGLGPTDAEVVLFAACPPPEELGFEPATGHWRKPVSRSEVALWESRPTGAFCGEPCLVLDDLGERLHIAYLGDDPYRAARLGYHQVEPAVFEVVTSREAVTGLTEERVDHTLRPWRTTQRPEQIAPDGPAPAPPVRSRRRRASGPPSRAETQRIFSELAGLAAIPQASYAVDEQVDGAICLVSTSQGYEVFTASDGIRHEVRLFDDEEVAYFYLFGLLTAEAVRDGRLAPPSG